MREELCEVGQDLWEHYRSTLEEDLYKNYVNHIKSCSECIRKLGLTEEDTEILNTDKNGLEPIDMKKLETMKDVELVEEVMEKEKDNKKNE